MKKRKGSLSLEAVIAATIFISTMFLLLTLVKLVLFMIIFNNATAETAKTLATAAYPLSYLNGLQEELEKTIEYTQPETLAASGDQVLKDSIITQLIGGGNGEKVAGDSVITLLKKMFTGIAVDVLKDEVYTLKGQGANLLCKHILSGYLDECGVKINPEKMLLKMVKLPQTELEYKTIYEEQLSQTESAAQMGFVIRPSSTHDGTDGDFNAMDVVICLEYDYQIALPMLPSFEIKLRSTAVERAWMYGTATGPSRKEGIDVSNILFGSKKVVYIATGGFGKRYHKADCHTLWSSNTTTTIDYAIEQGLSPCKVCKPPEG